MKKKVVKLSLNKETIAALNTSDMKLVVAGEVTFDVRATCDDIDPLSKCPGCVTGGAGGNSITTVTDDCQ